MLRLNEKDRVELARLSLEGLSVGDAFGQQFFFPELFRAGRSRRQLPIPPWKFTDDTIMAISVFEQLQQNGRIDQDELAAAFVSRFYQDPHRGYGSGAQDLLRQIDNGLHWRDASSKLFGSGSFGNGGAMRVAPLGAYFADDLSRVVQEASLSAEVTHAHSDGQDGAIAVAIAAAWATRRRLGIDDGQLIPFVLDQLPAGPVRNAVAKAGILAEDTWNHAAADVLGNGSRVTAVDTVPFCLWVASTQTSSYEEALWTVVQVGGDIDTNAAIVGGIVAISSPTSIPPEWVRFRESVTAWFG